MPGCGYMLMYVSLSLCIVSTAVCPGWFLACEAEGQRSNPMSDCSEPVSFLRWPGYSWDDRAERVLIACLWPKGDRSGFSPEWNDGFGCDCNDGLVHLKMETSLLFPVSRQKIKGNNQNEVCDSDLMKCYLSGQVKGLFNATGECSIIFTIRVSCLSSGTSRPLEDFRLSQFTWGCYKNNGFLLTSEISTRRRCGLQSIQKCPAQRSHQTDVSRWVPAPQMYVSMPFNSDWKFSQLHNSIWSFLSSTIPSGRLYDLNTPTLHLYVSAPTWPFLKPPPQALVLLAFRIWLFLSAILSVLSFFYFFCTARQTWTVLTMQRLDPFVTHTANLCLETQTRCIRNAYLMLGGWGGGWWESSLSGRWEGGMSGGSTSSVLTWLWVPAPWRAALHSLLSSLSNNLSPLSFPLLCLYFPSSLSFSSLSSSALAHSDFFFPLSSFNKLTKKKICHEDNWFCSANQKKRLQNRGVMWLKDEEKGPK